MKRYLWMNIPVFVALTLAACAPAPKPAGELPVPTPPPVIATVVVEKAVEAEIASYAPGPQALPPAAERMIVRTAQLSLVVKDTAASMDAVTTIAKELGGYVASASAWRQGEQLWGHMSVRVPANQFDTAMARFKELAVQVEKENISGQDVTEEYMDLNARLRNLEATETELLELLTTVRERMQKAQDVLEVYRELTNIRQQIEQLKGRMQYLEQMTALATIDLDFTPHFESKPVVEPGWAPLRTVRNASRSLVNALKFLVDAAIWLVIFVAPVVIIILIPIAALVLVIRWLVQRRRQSRAKPDSL